MADHHAILQRRHFHHGLVGLDLEQDLAAPEPVARLLQPGDDAAFFHRLAETRQRQIDLSHYGAAQAGGVRRASHKPVSPISCALGTELRSRGGETGIGMSSPATRATGSSR